MRPCSLPRAHEGDGTRAALYCASASASVFVIGELVGSEREGGGPGCGDGPGPFSTPVTDSAMQRYAILAQRDATSALGVDVALLKVNGEVLTFPTFKEADAEARRIMEMIHSTNLTYHAVALGPDNVEGRKP